MNGLQVNLPTNPCRAPSDKLTVFSWGLFFTWIGAALLADVGWPVGVLGAGVIALGMTLVLRALSRRDRTQEET